jgi:predicted choloylglycine hydrolase
MKLNEPHARMSAALFLYNNGFATPSTNREDRYNFTSDAYHKLAHYLGYSNGPAMMRCFDEEVDIPKLKRLTGPYGYAIWRIHLEKNR